MMLDNLHLALPEMIILATACLALLGDLFFKDKVKNIALLIALQGLALAFIVNLAFLGSFKAVLFNGLFISDELGQLMKLFIYLSVFLCFLYSKDYLITRKIDAGDFYLLALFSTLGMTSLVSAHSLLSMYLSLELVSLPLYAMTAMRRDDSLGTEAALKYFIMGAIASGLLLFGFSLLYGATGHLDLLDISNAIAIYWEDRSLLLSFALVFIIAGFGFKLAAVPFHMWAPDVYQGAPTPVTLFISTAPKIAALGMILRMISIALLQMKLELQELFLVMALLSAGLGNLFALTQHNLKRLFAYSAIAHAGYALFGLLVGTPAGFAAALYYILVYSLMAAAAFGLLLLLSRVGFEVESIDDLKGLNKQNPWLALMMMIVLFSLAGIPPTVGFFAKLAVLKVLVDQGLTWVAILGVFFSVIGAYYYIKIIKVMYFDTAETLPEPRGRLPLVANLVYSLNCLSLLYLGIFPGALLDYCLRAF